MVYKVSTNGTTWSSENIVAGASGGSYFAVWFDGTYVHYARYYNNDTMYRRGTPNADNTITWSAAEQTAVDDIPISTYYYRTTNLFDNVYNLETASGVFGYENKGGSYEQIWNLISGSWFTCPESATATSITAWFRIGAYGTTNLKCAIYKKSDNSLVGYTEAKSAYYTVDTDVQITFNIISGGSLNNDNYYLVAWSSNWSGSLYYNTEASKGTQMSQTYGTWPDPLSPTSGSHKHSIYCTYTAENLGTEVITGTNAANKYFYINPFQIHDNVPDNTSLPSTITIKGWRSTGTLTFGIDKRISVTTKLQNRVAVSHAGELYFRVWKSANADMSNAVLAENWTSQSYTFSAVENENKTVTTVIYLDNCPNNEYLYIEFVWKITTPASNINNFGSSTTDINYSTTTDNRIVGTKFTCPTSGTAENIVAYINTGTAPHKWKAAIYYENLDLMGSTDERTFTTEQTFTWQTFTFSNKPSLTANTSYWLVVWAEDGRGFPRIFGKAGTTNQSLSQIIVYDSWPNPLSPTSYDNRAYDIYCVYTSTTYENAGFRFSANSTSSLFRLEAQTCYTVPTISVSDNEVFIGYMWKDSTNYWARVTKATVTDGTWTTSSGFPYLLSSSGTGTVQYADPIGLTGGKCYVVYSLYSGGKLTGRLWNGSWSSEENVSTAIMAGGRLHSMVAQGDDVYATFTNLTADLISRKRTYGVGWENENTIYLGTDTDYAPSLTLDSSTGDLYCFWFDDPTENRIYYKKYTASTRTWDAAPTLFYNENEGFYSTYSDFASTSIRDYNNKILITWTSKTASPYNVKFDTSWAVLPGKPILLSPDNNTSTTDNRPTFTWTCGSGADNHRIEVDDNSNFSSPIDNVVLGATDNTWTKPAPGYATGTYYWRVWAINDRGENVSENTWQFTITTPVYPTKPQLYLPSDGATLTDNTPYFEWTCGENAENHRLLVDNDPDFSSPNENRILTTDNYYTIADENSLPDDNYSWKVIAINENGENSSDVWTFVVDTVAPSAPTLVSPENNLTITDNTPTFVWTEPETPENYTLVIDNDADFGSPVQTITNITDNTYTLTTELLDGIYYWRVREVDQAGNSGPWSENFKLTLDTTPPAMPTLVWPAEGENINDNIPTLDWDTVSDASLPVLYRVHVSDDSQFPYDNMDSGWISDENYTTSELAEGVWYWRVQARDNAGNVGDNSASRSFRVDITSPPEPGLISPTDGENLNDNTPTLDWSDVPDNSLPVTYGVQVDDDDNFSSPTLNVTGLSSSTYTTQELAECVWYWRANARDNAGNMGAWSVMRSFRVDITALSAPALLMPENNAYESDSTPTFRWTEPDTPENYTLVIDNDADFSSPTQTITDITDNTYTLTTALPDGVYYWRVREIDQAGNLGAWSGSFKLTVDTVPPVVSVEINGGESYTSSTEVNIGIRAFDATSGLDAMQFSDDGIYWSSWEPFAASKTYTLPAGDGTKTVYIRVRDKVGFTSSVASDSIILYTVLPPKPKPKPPSAPEIRQEVPGQGPPPEFVAVSSGAVVAIFVALCILIRPRTGSRRTRV